jgi:hypothetical protein
VRNTPSPRELADGATGNYTGKKKKQKQNKLLDYFFFFFLLAVCGSLCRAFAASTHH